MSVQSYHSGIGDGPPDPGLAKAISISALCHLLVFAATLYYSHHRPEKRFVPSVIRVNMVSLPPAAPPAALPAPPRAAVAPAAPKRVPAGKKSLARPAAKNAVSLSRKKVRRKTSMKKKTYRPSQVVKKAIRRIEKQVDKGRADPLAAALKRLKAKVADTDSPPRTGPAAQRPGSPAPAGAGKVRQLALIDIYRVEIAYQIQKNWAFSGSMAGGRADLTAELAFTVMPDGQIREIWFDKRSGNRYLDESARKAIVKSNPVRPHPAGLLRPYVTVGLRFTPEGVAR